MGPGAAFRPTLSLLGLRRQETQSSSSRFAVTASCKSGPAPTCLKQLREFTDGETGLSDDSAECSPVQFLMVGNNQLCEGFLAAEDDMAAFLALKEEADPFQRSHAFSP